MKRIRRITVEIVQQRQQFALRSIGTVSPREQRSVGLACQPDRLPEVCPMCGAPWVLLHETKAAGDMASLPGLIAALASLDLHLQFASAERLWICQRSYDRLTVDR